jgi:peptide-methionine (S)-S-oxide reductase
MKVEKATFGAGCFWGVEEAFRKVQGVLATSVGYAGGHTDQPRYENVCAGDTGHAEVVQVDFDPDTVTYDELLDIFWNSHDPTQKNRQGPDVGSQYRSMIFYHSPEQMKAAEASRKRLDMSGYHSQPVATEIVPFDEFFRAEDYHQEYFKKHGVLKFLTGR